MLNEYSDWKHFFIKKKEKQSRDYVKNTKRQIQLMLLTLIELDM